MLYWIQEITGKRIPGHQYSNWQQAPSQSMPIGGADKNFRGQQLPVIVLN